jgi:AcrR family transcriptional regulator
VHCAGWHAGAVNAPRTARERARREITGEIVAAARAQLAEAGAQGLSLRAVARELGMVSSAVYRYFPSRDALLTTLLVEGYDALGAAVEEAEAAVDRADLAGRWAAAGRSVRSWAREHPHEYALLFGSPVPGYAAPRATVDPASRVPRVLLGVLADAAARDAARADDGPPGTEPAGRPTGSDGGAAPGPRPGLVPGLLPQLEAGAGTFAPEVPPELLARGVLAWAALLGMVSFELFGHFVGSVEDAGLLLEQQLADNAAALGLGAG